MDFVHRCAFCGWRREAAYPTVVSPSCQRCGCLLVPERKDQHAADAPPLSRPSGPAPGRRRAERALRLVAGLSIVFTATASAYRAGGITLALLALGASGLFASTFVRRGPYG